MAETNPRAELLAVYRIVEASIILLQPQSSIIQICMQELHHLIPDEFLRQPPDYMSILDGARMFIPLLYPDKDRFVSIAKLGRSKTLDAARSRLRMVVPNIAIRRVDFVEYGKWQLPKLALLVLETIKLIKALEFVLYEEDTEHLTHWIRTRARLEQWKTGIAKRPAKRILPSNVQFRGSNPATVQTSREVFTDSSTGCLPQQLPQSATLQPFPKNQDADGNDYEENLLKDLELHIDNERKSLRLENEYLSSTIPRRQPSMFTFPIDFQYGRPTQSITLVNGEDPTLPVQDFVRALRLPVEHVEEILGHIVKHKDTLTSAETLKENGTDVGEVVGPELRLQGWGEEDTDLQIKQEPEYGTSYGQASSNAISQPAQTKQVSPKIKQEPLSPSVGTFAGVDRPPPAKPNRKRMRAESPPPFLPHRPLIPVHLRDKAAPAAKAAGGSQPAMQAMVVQESDQQALIPARDAQDTTVDTTMHDANGAIAPVPAARDKDTVMTATAMETLSHLTNATRFITQQAKDAIGMRATLRAMGMGDGGIQYCVDQIGAGTDAADVLRRMGWSVDRWDRWVNLKLSKRTVSREDGSLLG